MEQAVQFEQYDEAQAYAAEVLNRLYPTRGLPSPGVQKLADILAGAESMSAVDDIIYRWRKGVHMSPNGHEVNVLPAVDPWKFGI